MADRVVRIRDRRRRAVVTALAGLLLLAALALTQARRVRDAAEATVFGLPLVLMALTQAHAARTLGPDNVLHRVRRFPDAAFRAVVRPNVDTLYTTAFIDMDAGPWVFEMPPNDQRYELMPFLDAWTNVFATPGTRHTGTAGGRFLLAGPRWQGEVPPGLTLLRSPTRRVWLIGRTQTNGPADFERVHRLQDGLRLAPLAGPAAAEAWQPATVAPPAPSVQLQAMSTVNFFARLAQEMADNPAAAADAPMVDRLAGLGLRAGRPPAWGPLDRATAALGRWLAVRALQRALQSPRVTVNGWATPPSTIGRFGTDYALRAGVALVGLGANRPEDAMYPSARQDGEGQPLDGSRRYRIHFAPDALPPVDGFWSITAYGADEFLLAHPAGRHALGDRDGLQRNPDGSLDLWIQAEPPSAGQQANWLPVRAGEPFTLTARLYGPAPAALDGRWQLPPVQRLP